MRLIAENNNLPAQNHYFQATKTVLKIKTLLPELQKLYELLAPGWGLFGFLFSLKTLGFFFLLDWGRAEIKPPPFLISEEN